MKHVDAIPYQNTVGDEYLAARDYDSFSHNGSGGGFNLADFLSHTSNTEVAGDVITPQSFFDVEFKFFPGEAQQQQNTFLAKLVKEIYKLDGKPKTLTQVNDQLVIQLGMYVQSMSLPQMSMPEAAKTPTLFGEFPVNNLYVKPESNTFTMTILNTKLSLHDYLFYPWMREATLPKWSYARQPYTTANVYVSFAKHSNVQYVFAGSRPSQIGSRNPDQAPDGQPTRDITMLFDYMFILPVTNSTQHYYTSSAAYSKLEKAGPGRDSLASFVYD